MPKQPVYLVDGSAYIYRAYHAIAPLSNSKGLATHAIYGYIGTLQRILKEKSPSHLAVAFDLKGPTFRHEIYSDYKANRPPMPEDLASQIPYIHELTRALGLPTLELQGAEADDLIASAARTLSDQGHEVIFVSGDKDLLQLVAEHVQGWEPMKNLELNRDHVLAKYDMAPEGLLDFFALIGDKSDNVPGITGVGPKTAAKLLKEHESLDNLLANLDRLKKSKLKENLLAQQEMALLSRQLIRLKEDVDVPSQLDDYAVTEPDTETLRRLYEELEFSRFLNDLDAGPQAEPETFNTAGFQLVQDSASLAELAEKLKHSPFVVLDTETTSLNPLDARLVGISLATNADEAWYLPISHCDAFGQAMAGQLSLEEVQQALGPVLLDKERAVIGHNLKYDLRVLGHHGLPATGPLYDTLLVSYLLDPSRRSHKLDDLAHELLGITMTSFKEVTGKDKRPDAFAYVGLKEACHYSCEDVAATLAIWAKLHQQLQEQGIWPLFSDVEMALLPILADMEERGVLVSKDTLAQLSAEFDGKLAELAQAIHGMAGEEFNINSPKQLGTVLFETLGLPHGRKTKTGYSTDVKVLEKLASYHELPAAVLEYRSLSKLKSTYADALREQIHPSTGRIHTSYNQAVAATGRLSSSNPNLQNIPIRTEEGQRIRAAFIAEEGSTFLAADYSQIDLRVLAHYSQDEALLHAFRTGQDIHNQTAAEIFRCNAMLLTPEMRRVAKSINFGIVYGMSAFGLSSQLKISRKEAKESRFFLRLLDTGDRSQVERERNALVQEAGELVKILSAIIGKSS